MNDEAKSPASVPKTALDLRRAFHESAQCPECPGLVYPFRRAAASTNVRVCATATKTRSCSSSTMGNHIRFIYMMYQKPVVDAIG